MRRFCLLLLASLCFCITTGYGSGLSFERQTLIISGQPWHLTIPSDTQLELLTDKLDQPRLLHFLPNGDLLIGSRSGNLYRLAPPYHRPEVLVRPGDYPHSVAYRNGELLIAQTGGLYHVPYQPGQRRIKQEAIKLLAALPAGGGHNSRTVATGPDQRVYLSLGISGNCTDEYLDKSYPFDRRRGGILLLDESGTKPQWRTYAAGLRNPVGFAWHPKTAVLYATNNGPDHLGFEQPPEYFARLTASSFHGMPWFQFDGKTIRRDRCIRQTPPRPLSDAAKPVATFPARNAPMGVAFVPDNALDSRFTDNAIVALRGSWATRPDGGAYGNKATRRPPRLMMVMFENGKAGKVMDIVSGFQRPDGERLARPVGVAIGPDGALYFTSDSHTQGLFRLSSKRSRVSHPHQSSVTPFEKR